MNPILNADQYKVERAICDKAAAYAESVMCEGGSKRKRKLLAAWRERDDCERGYTSCFRKPGLDYLNAIGYRVIQAI